MTVELIDTLFFKVHAVKCFTVFITQYNIVCDNDVFDIAKYKIKQIDCEKEKTPIDVYYFDENINTQKLRNVVHVKCESPDEITFTYLKDFTPYTITGSIIAGVTKK